MRTDKLNVTARAAGFAMACDEAAVPQPAYQQQPVLALPAPKSGDGTMSAPVKPAPVEPTRSFLGFGMQGWGCWKTA
jgi:hypothetical protein